MKLGILLLNAPVIDQGWFVGLFPLTFPRPSLVNFRAEMKQLTSATIWVLGNKCKQASERGQKCEADVLDH